MALVELTCCLILVIRGWKLGSQQATTSQQLWRIKIQASQVMDWIINMQPYQMTPTTHCQEWKPPQTIGIRLSTSSNGGCLIFLTCYIRQRWAWTRIPTGFWRSVHLFLAKQLSAKFNLSLTSVWLSRHQKVALNLWTIPSWAPNSACWIEADFHLPVFF